MKITAGPTVAGGFLAAVLLGTSAVFAEPIQTATPVQTTDWSGYYVGLSAARPTGDNTWRVSEFELFLIPDEWSGTLSTLSLGRDWQIGRLIFGAVLGVSNGEIAAQPQSDIWYTCFQCDTLISNLVSLRGRAGLDLGKTMVYAAGGVTQADVAGTSGNRQTVVNSDTLVGWTLGVGLERKITGQISLTAGYDFTDLGNIALERHVEGTDTSIEFGLMQIGVNYRW
ncbi:outer membrane beta-barrel protein [Tabrizicola sp.]|uniref:outer membrane protein n=1 Tax=Tabrizicola sp. TaxID=2005166 RepID=UPI0025DE126C|nr:outer membrane beta-barrel protein [Tabrizicola sp.]